MWRPETLDTGEVEIPSNLTGLVEIIAEEAHAVWGRRRIGQGWRYGTEVDHVRRTHPMLVAYPELPEEAKDDDRELVRHAIRVLLSMGYTIVPADVAAEPTAP
ncbi:MAG TPA: RyR domain-containing protein [Candidatus Limnocylindrales bacterium]|nr:RyR domain-containing protein [Candidatus Limnocylindrales bacterium]